MKSRILGQINKNENYPLFSLKQYQEIQSESEKKQYLLNYLQYFINRFETNNQRQKIIPSLLNSFKDFSEILSNSFSLLLPNNFIDVLTILPIENSVLETITYSSNFLEIIDLMIVQSFQHSDKNTQKSFSNAVLALLANEEFCRDFIKSEKYFDTLITIADFTDEQLINLFLDNLSNETFINLLIENAETENGQYLNISQTIFHFLTRVLTRVLTAEMKRLDSAYLLIEFCARLIASIFLVLNSKGNSFSDKFIEELSKLGLFDQVNDFFILHPTLSFLSIFYEKLVNLNSNDNNKQFNSTIIKHLNSLYCNEKFSVEDGRVVVMHFFQTLNINYFSNNEIFNIFDWINDSVFKSSLLFQVTSSFLSKLIYYDVSILPSFINFFILKISPPAKSDFVYNDIFTWLLSLISLLADDENESQNENYINLHYFFEKIIYEPSLSDVSYYLINFVKFKQLLLQILIFIKESDKRIFDSRKIVFNNDIIINNNSILNEKYFSKLVELITFNKNNDSLQELFMNFLKNSFGKNLILYFFQNIGLNDVQILLFYLAQELTNEFIDVIKSFNLFDEILKNFNQSNISIFLKFINFIAVQTNDHFFDDYVICHSQGNFPLFTLNIEQWKKYILPPFYDSPIPIPSLIPLLNINIEKSNYKSPYNHFLLGKYSMPIYNKLNIPISKIPCLEQILNQYIRFQDFYYVFQNCPNDSSTIIHSGKQPEFPFNFYEIFPSEKPSCIMLNITHAYAVFKMRFESNHHVPSSLFNINDSPVIFMKDNFIYDISNKSIAQIELGKWYSFSFFYNKSLKILNIGIDSEIVSSIQIMSKDSNYKIKSIGSSQKPNLIHYMIMNSVAVGSHPDVTNFSERLASKYFKPQGNILFVLNQSFQLLFESKNIFTCLCEMIEQTKELHNKTLLFVSLMNNWLSSTSVSAEWHLNRYFYCMMQISDYCKPIYFTSILQTIIHLNDKIIRTKLFYTFFYDYFFFANFPEHILAQCIDFVNTYIDDFGSVFDAKILEETNICTFLLSLCYFFRNSFLLNELLSMIKKIFISFDDKIISPHLSNLALISLYLKNTDEIEIEFDFEKEQNFCYTALSFINEIRAIKNIKIFRTEEILGFALLINNQQLAINFIMEILQFCESDQFVQSNLSVLCRIVSRFPSNNLIWQKLFQLITNDKSFSLQAKSNYNSENGIRVAVFPLIFSALIPLFKEESKFAENIKKYVFRLLIDNQLILISKTAIKIFFAFINGSIYGETHENLENQVFLDQQKFEEFYPIFLKNVNNNFSFSLESNSSFNQYISQLICNMLIAQLANFKRFSLIMNVVVNSTNPLLIQVLITLFSTYIHIELTSQELALLNDISLLALLNEKDLKTRNIISNNIFIYCVHSHERFLYFSKFFAFSYKYVSNDAKYRTLRAFDEYFKIQHPKTLNEIIPFLYIIICTDLNPVLSVNKVESNGNILKIDFKNRLLNKSVYVKSENEPTIQQFENDSFAFKLFEHFLLTFKPILKDNELDFLFKFKDFNDFLINQNDDINGFAKIKTYISLCMTNLEEEAHNSYKIIDIKGTSLPADNFASFILSYFTEISQKSVTCFNTIFSDMNYFLRYFEKYYATYLYTKGIISSQELSIEELKEKCKSYHVSPFCFPGICPVMLVPSPFSTFGNTEYDKNIFCDRLNKIKIKLFGLEKKNNFVNSFSDNNILSKFDGHFDYQNDNHELKVKFNYSVDFISRQIDLNFYHLNTENKQQQIIQTFISIYGKPNQIINCILIRKFIRIPSILFKYKDIYLILTNCEFNGQDIDFIPENKERDQRLIFQQSVLLNEFGNYYLFYGNPLIHLRLSDFIIAFQCTDDTVTWSVNIYSYVNGSFVLSFSRENNIYLQHKFQQQLQTECNSDPPTIHLLTRVNLLKNDMTDTWLKGRISNIQYLTILNLLSGRSFDDMSSYPIVPRVLSTFSGSTFKEDCCHLRNLNFSVSVLSESLKSKSSIQFKTQAEEDQLDFEVDLTDPCFDTLKMRYEMQKYHNCENISNGSVVSSFMIRIPPFCNYSLEFNEGSFDDKDRIFSSINMSCGINKFSTAELIPELFLMPEMLNNSTNKIKFPDGVPNDVILPQWSEASNSINSCYNFIQMHRFVFESKSVRNRISKWIDLVFGFKQTGEEAINSLNLYNPLSYQFSIPSMPMLLPLPTLSKAGSENLSLRADFVKNSGQMPIKIFNSPHQPYSSASLSPTEIAPSSNSILESQTKQEMNSNPFINFVMGDRKLSPFKKRTKQFFNKITLFGFSFDDIAVSLVKDRNISKSILIKEKGLIIIKTMNKEFKLFNAEFYDAKEVSLSKRGNFLSVTFCSSKVKVYRLLFNVSEVQFNLHSKANIEETENATIIEMSFFYRNYSKFSVINDKQLICATVCEEEVIIWTIINGSIIHIIPLKNVKSLAFDDELNLIYLAAGTKLFQFSLNNQFIRSIDTKLNQKVKSNLDIADDIESISIGGFGFSYDMRFIAVGKRSGKVLLVKQNKESLDLEIYCIFDVSKYPIKRLICRQNNYLIEANDSHEVI